VTGGGAYREIFALLRQVSLSSVPKQAGECVKKNSDMGIKVVLNFFFDFLEKKKVWEAV
jgi:hypothetical protein